VRATRLLASIARRQRRWREAEGLLATTIERAPDFDSARHDLALTQFELSEFDKALGHLDWLIEHNPTATEYRKQKASALSRLGLYDEAAEQFEQMLADGPEAGGRNCCVPASH